MRKFLQTPRPLADTNTPRAQFYTHRYMHSAPFSCPPQPKNAKMSTFQTKLWDTVFEIIHISSSSRIIKHIFTSDRMSVHLTSHRLCVKRIPAVVKPSFLGPEVFFLRQKLPSATQHGLRPGSERLESHHTARPPSRRLLWPGDDRPRPAELAHVGVRHTRV